MNIKTTAIASVLLMGLAGTLSAEDAYVQSDGTQYINTGFTPTPKTKVVADFAYTATTPVQQRVFGVSGSSVGLTCALYINGGGNYAWALQNNDGNWYSTDVQTTTARRRLTLDGPGNLAKLETWQSDGSWVNARADMSITTTRTQNGKFPIYLFANNQDGSSINNKGKLRLYSFKIYENGELVRDYVPARYGDVGVLREVQSGTLVQPVEGNNLTFGGDIGESLPLTEYVWTGAAGTSWTDAGNWSLAGAASPNAPKVSDAVVVDTGAAGSTTTISLAGFSSVPSVLTVRGSGTLLFADVPLKCIAGRLVIEGAAKVSSAGTLYVKAAQVGGADLAKARYAATDWIAGGDVNVDFSAASVSDNVLTLEVAADAKLVYTTQLAATLTKVVKIGPGTAVVTNEANASFTGVTEIRQGVLEVQSSSATIIPTLGNKKANTVTVFDGGQLLVTAPAPLSQGEKRFNNQFVIAGAGLDGTGALRFNKSWSAGTNGNCDSMFSDVTLADDAHISSSGARFGLGGGTIDFAGHTLDVHPNSSAAFMINGGTWKDGTLDFGGTMNPVIQNANTFSGTGTMNLASGVTLGLWGPALTFDWTLVAKGGSSISLGAGTSDTANNIRGPITLDGGTMYLRTYTSTAGMRQHLSGKISGTGALQKTGISFVFLDNAANDWTGGVQVNGAEAGGLIAKYPGAVPAAGPVTVTTGVLGFDGANWQGGDVKTLAERAAYKGTGFIAPYLAANGSYTLSEDFDVPVRLGAWNAGTFNIAGRLADNSQLSNYGATLKVTGNNDGVILGGFNLRNGTTVFDGTGYFNLTNNACTIGATNSSSVCRVVVTNGAALARFVPSSGGAANATQQILVRDWGAKGAILDVRAGGAVTNKIQIGTTSGTKGALYVDGGSACMLSRDANDGYLGQDGYGFTGVYAGVYDIVGWLGIGTGTGGSGVFEQTGGTVKLRNQGFAPSRGGSARVRFSGGTFTGNSDYIRMGEQQWGVKGNTSATAVLTVDGDAHVKASWLAIVERTNTFTSVVNLNGGVFEGQAIRKADWQSGLRTAAAKGYVGFNGGTFKTSATKDGDFYNIFGWETVTCDCVRVYSKGATISASGRASNGACPFTAAPGKGVSAITIPSGTTKTGYIGSPEVVITGDGFGASAWCTFDHTTGTIGEIIVTSPGWNYTTASATIKSADRTSTITCPVTLADNVSGGLTVTGGGIFSLYGTENTYGGETFVTNATLHLSHAGAIPSTSPVRLAKGTLDLNNKSQTVATLGGAGLVKNGTLTVTDALAFDAATAQDKTTNLVITANVTVPSEVRITDVENLDQNKPTGVLCTFATPQTQTFSVNLPAPWRVFLTDGGKSLRFVYQQATMLILR